VEEAGAKVEAHLRGAEPREAQALYAAIGDAIHSVPARDAQGWFSDRARYVDSNIRRDGPQL
jgi:hypothetical protein